MRFTAHDQTPKNLATVLDLFDERLDTELGIGGGRLKELALISRSGAPYKVKFKDRPSLDGLFNELALTFAVRYEQKPSEAAWNALKYFQCNNLLSSFVADSSAYQYQQRMEKLQNPTWLVETIRRFLQDRSLWPTDDKAISQMVGIADGTRKRTLGQARMELQVPRPCKVPKTA